MDKDKKIEIVICIGILIAMIAVGFGCWKLERWINWKLDYGDKVEKRIQRLEKRIEKLEGK